MRPVQYDAAVSEVPSDRGATWSAIVRGIDTTALDIVVGHLMQIEGPERALRFLARGLDDRALGMLLVFAVHQLTPTVPQSIDADVERLFAEVRTAFGVERMQILGPSRQAGVVTARHVVMYVARTILLLPLTDIGRRLGRDHSTVIHGVERVARMKRVVPEFDARLTKLILSYTGGTNHGTQG